MIFIFSFFTLSLDMNLDDERSRMLAARIPKRKPEKKPMRRMSLKRQAKETAEKKLLSSDGDTLMERFYKAARKLMVGVCQCGCCEPSQKKDDIYFRHSVAHIFPKRLFPSIMYHPLNWVERRFWGGCHSIMDDTSMDRWPNMADWESIKEKFYILAPLLTDEERATNFYTRLEKLVYGN
jgi:hypothetical protein